MSECYMVLLATEDYVVGVLTLAHSLRQVKSTRPLVVMLTPDMSMAAREALDLFEIPYIEVPLLLPPPEQTPDLGMKHFVHCWTKIRAFGLTQYKRIVFLDADQVVLKSIDDLFNIDIPKGWIAAVQDCRCEHHRLNPPIEVERGVCPFVDHGQDGPNFKLRFQSGRLQHLFNVGLFVCTPAVEQLDMLLHTLRTDPVVLDFRAPEQDLMVHCFRFKWKSLSYRFHTVKTLQPFHPDLVLKDEVKMLHLFYDKPWSGRDSLDARWEWSHSLWWKSWDDLAKDRRVQSLPEEFKATEIRKIFTHETGKP